MLHYIDSTVRKPLSTSPHALSQILAANLTAALAVAGTADEYGRPRRLKSTQLQRDTKIARSTLRTLKTYSKTREVNPDLQTLNRIAKALEIPVAFLLFGPNEWQALLRAVDDMALMLVAAEKLEEEASLAGPQAAVQILRKLKVYPFVAPNHAGASEAQQGALDQLNESRRRTTLVAAALAQAAARDRKSHKRLTALAASLANQAAAF
jgi:DNA-binding Xre family transcriptional regulator